MFSKPLAYPSTLDHRPLRARARRSPSYVEGFWSPFLDHWRINRTLKHTLLLSRSFSAPAENLSLSGGASISIERLFKLSITSGLNWLIASRNNEGDPLGRPRLARYAARKLARIPPSEGQDVTGPAALIEPMPARRCQRGRRRFGKEHFGFDGNQHDVVARGRVGE
jgi:hypothetical protein